MKVLFISISPMRHMSQHSISQDLLREFRRNGHDVYIVCALERRSNENTYLSEEEGCKVLRVKTGNNKKAGIIEKGLNTVLLPNLYISAIKKYYSEIKFDLVLYPTPPITHVKTVRYIKKRDGASSYLLLKDIFPQNAIDIGLMKKNGVKGVLYRYFRKVEKDLYEVSDRIGCMSKANVEYLLTHNPEIDPQKVEIFPNSIEVVDVSINAEQRREIREKYNIPLDKKVFVYGGNLGKPQGIDFVISCFPKMSEFKEAFFLIVGDGTEYKRLADVLEKNRWDNIRLLKKLPKDDYDKMIASCDVGLIFLDHRFTIPNFPSRMLAYLQAHLPIIAATDPNTDVGKTIEEGLFGWWCESDNINHFCLKVKDAMNSDLMEMGENGFRFLIDHYQVKDTYRIIAQK